MSQAAFALLAAAAFVLIHAQPSAAETYRPWCVQYTRSDATNCGFTSYEQCMLTARGNGYCVQNPWYLQYGAGQRGLDQSERPRRR